MFSSLLESRETSAAGAGFNNTPQGVFTNMPGLADSSPRMNGFAARPQNHPDRLPQITDEIDRCLSQPWYRVRFPAALERRFEQETAPSRCSQTRFGLLFMSCAHLALVFGDSLQGKHMLMLGLGIRAGLCVPLLLLGAWLLRSNMPPWLQGLMVAGPAAFTFFCDEWLALHVAALQGDRYFMGTLMGLFTSNLLLPLRPRTSLLYNAASLVTFNAVLLGVLGPLPMGRPGELALAVSILVIVSAGIRWRDEILGRRTFLLTQRDRLHTQQLAWANHQLKELSYTDPLTGLANRRSFQDALKRLWNEAHRSGLPLSILMIDIDHFKDFNDTQGHGAGDKCLRKVAQAMQLCVRVEKDSLARYGGEEFIAVVPGTSPEAAMQIAERLRGAVEDLQIPHPSSPLGSCVTACVGVATTIDASTVTEGVDTVLRAADFALYVAKSKGRNCVMSHHIGENPDMAALMAVLTA